MSRPPRRPNRASPLPVLQKGTIERVANPGEKSATKFWRKKNKKEYQKTGIRLSKVRKYNKLMPLLPQTEISRAEYNELITATEREPGDEYPLFPWVVYQKLSKMVGIQQLSPTTRYDLDMAIKKIVYQWIANAIKKMEKTKLKMLTTKFIQAGIGPHIQPVSVKQTYRRNERSADYVYADIIPLA